MTLTEKIKAMPTIADANGDLCVSRAAVLALLEMKAEEWRNNEDNAYRQIVYENCAAELIGE